MVCSTFCSLLDPAPAPRANVPLAGSRTRPADQIVGVKAPKQTGLELRRVDVALHEICQVRGANYKACADLLHLRLPYRPREVLRPVQEVFNLYDEKDQRNNNAHNESGWHSVTY